MMDDEEITEEMISAGASALADVSYIDLAEGWLRPEDVVGSIYRAMREAIGRSPSSDREPQYPRYSIDLATFHAMLKSE